MLCKRVDSPSVALAVYFSCKHRRVPLGRLQTDSSDSGTLPSIQTQPKRGVKGSRAEEITCDKLAMVSEVLGIWSGVILPFLFSITGVFDEVYSL